MSLLMNHEIAPRLSENEELTAKGIVWIDGVERPEYARVLEAQEFDQLFSKFLDLDIKDMVNYGAGVPGDGFNVTITIKSQPSRGGTTSQSQFPRGGRY